VASLGSHKSVLAHQGRVWASCSALPATAGPRAGVTVGDVDQGAPTTAPGHSGVTVGFRTAWDVAGPG
jgi:hypothetical protein